MIKKCDCTHEYQDKKYGRKNRVMVPTSGKKATETWRCTVCNKGHA